MAKVRSKNTTPEINVRRAAHALGLRFRLHRRDLPGSPDLTFVKEKKVLFVHGCFWHRHKGCRRSTTPKSNAEFWSQKFAANEARDSRVQDLLRSAGWEVIIIWECETKNATILDGILRRALLAS
jgi:DNA mismatch endonuclease (patch repair protein)